MSTWPLTPQRTPRTAYGAAKAGIDTQPAPSGSPKGNGTVAVGRHRPSDLALDVRDLWVELDRGQGAGDVLRGIELAIAREWKERKVLGVRIVGHVEPCQSGGAARQERRAFHARCAALSSASRPALTVTAKIATRAVTPMMVAVSLMLMLLIRM